MVFRVGVGKKIGGINFFLGKNLSSGSSKKNDEPSAKEKKDSEFQNFLYNCEFDVNKLIMEFFRLNGYDPLRLQREKIDLDDLFEGEDSYQEFSELVLVTKEAIEKVVYSGDTGIQAKRDISDNFFAIKAFINRYKQREHLNPKYAFLKEPEPQGILVEPVFLSSPKKMQSNSDYLRMVVGKIGLILLWVGILIMPYIFAWFTLNKRFSKQSRIVAFGWLAVVILIIMFSEKS